MTDLLLLATESGPAVPGANQGISWWDVVGVVGATATIVSVAINIIQYSLRKSRNRLLKSIFHDLSAIGEAVKRAGDEEAHGRSVILNEIGARAEQSANTIACQVPKVASSPGGKAAPPADQSPQQ